MGSQGLVMAEFHNWSGGLRFIPAAREAPSDEQQLCAIVRRATERGQTVRPVGKGHSFTPLVRTDGVLVSLHELTGVDRHDADRGEAVVWAETTVEQLGAGLRQLGLPHARYLPCRP
jgi:FAD/FMN-containing dehydrogenase